MEIQNEREELLRLQKEIRHHNYRYHVLDDPSSAIMNTI
jgi:NAD-dependent DNA ligase